MGKRYTPFPIGSAAYNGELDLLSTPVYTSPISVVDKPPFGGAISIINTPSPTYTYNLIEVKADGYGDIDKFAGDPEPSVHIIFYSFHANETDRKSTRLNSSH